MTRHPLDGNAIAADAHYGREEPEMRECDQCASHRHWILDKDDPQWDGHKKETTK